MNSLFNSQFSYCPLIWMLHSRIMNKWLHERCMHLIYENKTKDWRTIRGKTNLFRYKLGACKCWPQKCLKCIGELFCWRDISYKLRSNSNFPVTNVKSVFRGSKSTSNLGLKIWDIVPLELKEFTILNALKKGIKKWQPKNCPLRLCKQYVSNLVFVSNTSEICF